MKKGKIIVVQGGQWGSEGKGLITAHQAKVKGARAAVRTGSINAGHTVFYEGHEYKMQQIPTAWVVPDVDLYIGPGAYIHPEVMERELGYLRLHGINTRERVHVDHRCFLHTGKAENNAKAANRHHAMGATGKGSSEAIIEKLQARGTGEPPLNLLFENHPLARQVNITDVPVALMDHYNKGQSIVLEGTQGAHLDFHLGPHPFVTNRGCNAATWFAEAGLPPNLNTEVVMVCRTYPIRVAGNSGPMGRELSWPQMLMGWLKKLDDLGLPHNVAFDFSYRDVNEFAEALAFEAERRGCPTLLDYSQWTPELRHLHRVDLSEAPTAAWLSLSPEVKRRLSKYVERTTVTHKIRRIAEWDWDYFKQAVTWNNPDEIVLTFLNYEHPELWGAVDLTVAQREKVQEFSEKLGVPITWVSTAPGFEGLINTKLG